MDGALDSFFPRGLASCLLAVSPSAAVQACRILRLPLPCPLTSFGATSTLLPCCSWLVGLELYPHTTGASFCGQQRKRSKELIFCRFHQPASPAALFKDGFDLSSSLCRMCSAVWSPLLFVLLVLRRGSSSGVLL